MGNFMLSLPASWASIFLHVKAPDDGGCGPLPRARLARAAVRRRSGLGGQGLSGSGFFRRQRSSRELRFPPVSQARPSGPKCGAAAFGPEAGPVQGRFLRGLPASGCHASHSPGTENPSGGDPSGAGSRVALQFLAFGGKVPVALRPSPFRQGRLPFPVSGSRPIRDRAAPSLGRREGLTGQGRRPPGRRPGPGTPRKGRFWRP